MINLDLYFPTPVWWTDTNLNNEYLKDIVYNKKTDNPEGERLVIMVDGSQMYFPQLMYHHYVK